MPVPIFAADVRPDDWPLRVFRSAVVAVVCTATAILGHLSAGGRTPPAAAVAVFLGATAIAWLLSSRRVTPGQLVGLLLLCQVVVHLGLSGSDMTMSAAMLSTHALAIAVSAAGLARGEALVWQLVERLGLRVGARGLGVRPIPSWRPQSPAIALRSLRDVRLENSRAERGPPSGSR